MVVQNKKEWVNIGEEYTFAQINQHQSTKCLLFQTPSYKFSSFD